VNYSIGVSAGSNNSPLACKNEVTVQAAGQATSRQAAYRNALIKLEKSLQEQGVTLSKKMRQELSVECVNNWLWRCYIAVDVCK
jgi:hypothetical protein